MRKLVAVLVVITLVAVGTANANWSSIATTVWTSHSTSTTGYSGKFYYEDGVQSKSGVALATFMLTLPAGQGLDWLGSHRWYCADLSEWISPSHRDYYRTDDNVGIPGRHQGTPQGNRRAASILNRWSYSVSSNIGRAALQLAVWEAIYDNGSTFDVDKGSGTRGNFWVDVLSGPSTGAVLSAAAAYYSGSSDTGIGIYADDQQNLLRGVPEPGTVVLLGLGLAGCGVVFLRRRRS